MTVVSTARAQLTKLTKNIYFYEPTRVKTRAAVNHAPEVVLLLGWMDAQMKHLDKYVEGYQKVFPTSTILLVRSNQTAFYTRSSTQQQALSPAVDFLRSRLGSSSDLVNGPAQSSLLIHTFSNGGCLNLRTINELMLRKNTLLSSSNESHSEQIERILRTDYDGLPAKVFIFDSCPGTTSFILFIRAFTAPLSTSFLRFPAYLLVGFVYTLLKLWYAIAFRTPILDSLNYYISHQLPLVPRLYVYSESDLLIPYKDVEANARLVKERGGKVTLRKVEGSDHVGHMRKDKEGYWGAIQKLWEDSV